MYSYSGNDMTLVMKLFLVRLLVYVPDKPHIGKLPYTLSRYIYRHAESMPIIAYPRDSMGIM